MEVKMLAKRKVFFVFAVIFLITAFADSAQALVIYPDKETVITICEDGKKTTIRKVEKGGWEITKNQIVGAAIGAFIIKLIFDPPSMNLPLFENIAPPAGWSYSLSSDGQVLSFLSPTPIVDTTLIDEFSFESPVPFGFFDAGLVDIITYVESGIPTVLNLGALLTGESFTSLFSFDGTSVTYAELTNDQTLPTILSGTNGIPAYSCGNPVPEPSTMFLIGSGLVGFVGFRKKFKK
jgi:hypothetical protein